MKSFKLFYFPWFFFSAIVLLCPSRPIKAYIIDSNYNLLRNLKVGDGNGNELQYSRINFCQCTEAQKASAMAQRPVNTNILEEHKAEKDFQYSRTTKDEASSFWSSFKNWIIRKLFGNLTEETAVKTQRIIYWLIAILAIGIVSYWLYQSEFFGMPLQRATRIDNELFRETERSENDIDTQIRDALSRQNYSLAIRWVYIKCIKIMAENNEIQIRQDKTNYDYYLELKNALLKESFLKLTQLFECTHYGNFKGGISSYTEAEIILKEIKNKV